MKKVKLILFLISFIIICISLILSMSKSPYVTINVKNENIRKVLDELSKQTKIMFMCSDEVKEKVTINVKNKNIFEVLPEILEPLGYNWGHIDSHYYSPKGYEDGYYVAIAKTKYINPKLLKNGKDWPDQYSKRTLRDLKNQAVTHEYEVEIYQKWHLNKIMKKQKKRRTEREKERELKYKQLEKEGKILLMKPKYFYKAEDYKDKIQNPIKKQLRKRRKLKLLNYRNKDTALGFFNKNDNIQLEVKNLITTSFEKIKCKEVKLYNDKGKLIHKEKVNSEEDQIYVSDNGNYYMVKDFIKINEESKRIKFIKLKNKEGKEIFTKEYDPLKGYFEIAFFQEIGIRESWMTGMIWYNINGKKILDFFPEDSDVTYGDMSDNGEHLFFTSSCRVIYCFNKNGEELFKRYLPLEYHSGFGLISNNGNIYISCLRYPIYEKRKVKRFLLCINRNGSTLWRRDINSIGRNYDLINNDNNILVCSREGLIYLLDGNNGKLLYLKNFSNELKRDKVFKFFKRDLSGFNEKRIFSSDKHIFIFLEKIIYVLDYQLNLVDKIIWDIVKKGGIIRYYLKENSLYLISKMGIEKYDY